MYLKNEFVKKKNMKSISRLFVPTVKRHYVMDLVKMQFYYFHKNKIKDSNIRQIPLAVPPPSQNYFLYIPLIGHS